MVSIYYLLLPWLYYVTLIGNYDAVVKEKTELQRQLETHQHEMETLHTERARLLTENKKLQDSLTDYKSGKLCYIM